MALLGGSLPFWLCSVALPTLATVFFREGRRSERLLFPERLTKEEATLSVRVTTQYSWGPEN